VATWQRIGGIEVCEGTDGVVGVFFGPDEVCAISKGSYHGWYSQAGFETSHCQPLHEIEECADGSVIVRSTEKIDGKTARAAFVCVFNNYWWLGRSKHSSIHFDSKDEAIAAAVAYVTAR
jgi:hypothetical protein